MWKIINNNYIIFYKVLLVIKDILHINTQYIKLETGTSGGDFIK